MANDGNVSFAWSFKPCEAVSGDSLGIMPLDERVTGLHVLDVSGHGVAAALLSVSVRHFMSPVYSSSSLLRQPMAGSAAWRVVRPAEVAAELNRRFPFDADSGQFFTLLYGLFDTIDRTFTYVSAGHPGPVYLPLHGEAVQLKCCGRPIGLQGAAPYVEQDLPMGPGDRLYLFTDGIWEATDPLHHLFGPEHFFAALAEFRQLPLQDSVDRLVDRVAQWCGAAGLKDDASLLAVEVPFHAGHRPDQARCMIF